MTAFNRTPTILPVEAHAQPHGCPGGERLGQDALTFSSRPTIDRSKGVHHVYDRRRRAPSNFSIGKTLLKFEDVRRCQPLGLRLTLGAESSGQIFLLENRTKVLGHGDPNLVSTV